MPSKYIASQGDVLGGTTTELGKYLGELPWWCLSSGADCLVSL